MAIYILGDGKKLYRVFMNLYDNALKYSMKETKVYIDLKVENDTAIVTIKNIANYEMDFCQEDILERFVRGDKARTTDGSMPVVAPNGFSAGNIVNGGPVHEKYR